MKLYTLDKREIRSFRLRHKTLELKNFLENKNSFGLFMMSETLHPKEHINKRKEFIQHNLQIKNISKKITNFITKDTNWKPVKNLLSGNVILIKDKNSKTLSTDTINFVLKQNNLSTRFLFWNQNIYREKDLNRLINPKANINTPAQLSIMIRQIALKQLLHINPFIKLNNPNGAQTLRF